MSIQTTDESGTMPIEINLSKVISEGAKILTPNFFEFNLSSKIVLKHVLSHRYRGKHGA